MYFVKQGHALMTWDQYESVPIGVFGPGSIFGEIEVYKNTRRMFSCWAVTDLELFVLSKKNFKRIYFQNFPELGKKHLIIMDRAFEAIEGLMQMIQDFLILENSHLFVSPVTNVSPNFDRPNNKFISRNNQSSNFKKLKFQKKTNRKF